MQNVNGQMKHKRVSYRHNQTREVIKMLGIFKHAARNRKEQILQEVVFVLEWLIVGGGMLKLVSFGLDVLGVK